MKSRAVILPVAVAALAATGLGLRAIAPRGTADAGGRPGGFRALAADFAWLRANADWERGDAAATRAMLRLVVALDPRPLYFWLNGARMLAYDLPAWRIEAEGGFRRVPAGRQAQLEADGAREALGFLAEGMARHPASAALWIERANIELNGRHDLAAAAASYRRASEQPGAPYFAARLHAELLRRLGRDAEALAWLKRIHPQLPDGDEAAEAELVLARIRTLERAIGVPAAQAYVAPAGRRGGGPMKL